MAEQLNALVITMWPANGWRFLGESCGITCTSLASGRGAANCDEGGIAQEAAVRHRQAVLYCDYYIFL